MIFTGNKFLILKKKFKNKLHLLKLNQAQTNTYTFVNLSA